MKKISQHISLCLAVLLFNSNASLAQWINGDSSYNAGGLVNDRMQQAINSDSGFYSTLGSAGGADHYGVFEHYGRSGVGDSAAFINDGYYNASVNGIDYFYGPSGEAGQQAIAGSIAPLFGELYLNNGPASVFNITNLQGATVAKAVYFNNGITSTIRNNTDAGALRFLNDAYYTGIDAASTTGDDRYVDGYVSNIGNRDFIFPVGQNGIQALTVENVPASSQISVAYFATDPNVTPDPSDGFTLHPRSSVVAPLSTVSPSGFWDWIQRGSSSGSVKVSVRIPDVSAFASAANLRLVGWNGNRWINLSGSTGATGATRFNTVSGAVDLSAGITAIAIGSVVDRPLPVTLINFYGTVDEKCITHVNWVSAHEREIAQYSVEVSTDGLNYKTLEKIAAKNLGTTTTYSFDYKGLRGLSFIRLRILDMDNKFVYGPVIRLLSRCGEEALTALPNPATNTINIKGLAGAKNTIIIYSAAGAQVAKMISHFSMQAMDISHLPAGTYVLKVIDAGGQAKCIKIEKR